MERTADGGGSPWGDVSRLTDVLVAFVDLPESLGGWDPDSRVILLHRGMTYRETKCVLFHEMEHARRGDVAVDEVSSVLAARQEIAAQTRAASRLIPLKDLIRALQWSQDEYELAEELDVTVDLVRHRLVTLSPAEHHLIDAQLWLAEHGSRREEGIA